MYIVAVKNARLLTMCGDLDHVTFTGGGGWRPRSAAVQMFGLPGSDVQHLVIRPAGAPEDIREDPEHYGQQAGTAVWLPLPARQGSVSTLLERVEVGSRLVAVDHDVEMALRKEFGRMGRYEVVDSPDQADFVFLSDSFYYETQIVERSVVTVFAGADMPTNLRQAVLAIVVPIEAYQRSPRGIAALLRARIWEGSALVLPPYRYQGTNPVSEVRFLNERKTFTPAPAESVVRQLHGKEQRMPNHPVLCAATDQTFEIDGDFGMPSVGARATQKQAAPRVTAPALLSGQASGGRAAATFRTGITYVPVAAVAADSTGTPVVDLAPSEFRLYENDVEQKVDRVVTALQPFNMALLVDTSTSMHSAIVEYQEAVLRFVDALPSDDKVMLVSFDRRIFLQSPITGDRERLRRAVFAMDKQPGTRLYDAIRLALEQPSLASADRKAIVLLTDGLDTESRLADTASIEALATQSDAAIYAIQCNTAQVGERVFVEEYRSARESTGRMETVRPSPADFAEATAFLRRISAGSGGQFHAASTVGKLSDVFGEIAHDLNAQYTICYYPSNEMRDGTYRRIRVEVTRPGVTVRSRAGYRAGG